MAKNEWKKNKRTEKRRQKEVGKEPTLPIELKVFIRSHRLHWITVLNFRSTDGLMRMYTNLNPRALGVFALLLFFVAYLYVQRCTLQRSKKLNAVRTNSKPTEQTVEQQWCVCAEVRWR